MRAGAWALAALAVLGCAQPELPSEEFLIRSGKIKVYARDYQQALEMVKASYPGSLDPGSPDLKAARRQALDEMTAEVVMRRHAAALGLEVSPAELEAAVSAVKQDYPPGVFEQTLLESAFTFEAWKRRMHMRLLLEKLVDRELRGRSAVTDEEATAHFDRHYRLKAADGSEASFEKMKPAVVADLRQKKVEEAFGPWMEGLKAKYPVEINTGLLERLAAPPGAGEPAADAPAKPKGT
jgi:hypothetical protein